MDGERFDSLTKRLEARSDSRRAVLTAVLTGLGIAGGAGRVLAAGPCGNGSARTNTCRRNRQCCTHLCDRKRERCTCRKRGQACGQDRHCCRRGGRRLVCFQGTCQPFTCATGGPCHVFVTHSIGVANMGGLSGADFRCQVLADHAGLTGTYRAWISTATKSPGLNRFTNTESTGPYVLVDGTVIAADWAELTSGTLRAPITVTQLGTTLVNGQDEPCVWTNTHPEGTPGGTLGPDGNCTGWTFSGEAQAGNLGNVFATGAGWTHFGSSPCNKLCRLYCFEQG